MVTATRYKVSAAHRGTATLIAFNFQNGGASSLTQYTLRLAKFMDGCTRQVLRWRLTVQSVFGQLTKLAGTGWAIAQRLAAMPTLLVLLACQAAAAQGVTLSARETTQRGNFAVGFGTSTDNGNYALDVLTLEPAFANVASDSGAAAAAVANFTTAQSYAVFDDRVDFSGSAFTAIEAPPGVTAFADALSQLELVLVLSAATPFELRVDIGEALGATVNSLAPRANAQFRLSGPGDAWFYNTAGSFLQSGVLAAGTWRINAFADARGNGDGGFGGTLLLAPVPEPAAWLLMVLGLAAIGLRRVRTDAAIATQAWSTQP